MKYNYTFQVDRLMLNLNLGKRIPDWPKETTLLYSIVVYVTLDDITIYKTTNHTTMLSVVKQAAAECMQYHVYRRPLETIKHIELERKVISYV